MTVSGSLNQASSFGTISLDQGSTLQWASAASLLNGATITLNLIGGTGTVHKLIDFTGGTGTPDYENAVVANWSASRDLLRRADDDLWYTVSAFTTNYIDSAYTGSTGDAVGAGNAYYYNLNAFSTVAAALGAPDIDKVEKLVIGGTGTVSANADVAGRELEFLATIDSAYTFSNAGDTVFNGGSLAGVTGAKDANQAPISTLTLKANGRLDTASGFAGIVIDGDVTATSLAAGTVTVNTGKTLTVNKDSALAFGSLSGKLTLDATGGTSTYGKVVDYTGDGTFAYSADTVTNWSDQKANFTAYNNDLYVGGFTQETLYVDDAVYGGRPNGEAVAGRGIVGFNLFGAIADTQAPAASSDVQNIELTVTGATTTTYSRSTIYVNSGYTGDFGAGVAGLDNSMVGFNAYADFDAAKAVAGTNTAFNITGGTLSGNVYADGHALAITGAVNSSASYVFGGSANAAAAGDVTVSAAVTLKAVIGGSTVSAGDNVKKTTAVAFAGAAAGATSRIGLVAGGNQVTTNASINNDTSVTLSDNVTVTNFTVGGSFQSGTAAVTVKGDSSLTISAGTYGSRNADGTVKGAVVGGGLLQNTATESGSYTQDGNVDILINGGTIDTVLFGAGAARVPVASGKMKLNGDVSITVDASTNAVGLYEVYAGFNGAGTIGGNTTITFKGSGENLTFATVENETYNGVCGDNAGKSGIASKKTRTLAFDSFTGDFTANNIKKFDKISLTGSTVTFTQSGLNLSPVKTWDFAAGSSLTWTGTGDDYFASNTFAGDTLVFGHENESLTGSWTVMTGNADLFAGWNAVNETTVKTTVKLFGVEAEFYADADAGAWKTSAFSLTLQDNKLVVSALASI